MAGKKIAVEFEVQEDLVKMLEYASDKYRLGDKSKALRCLLDYAATDGNWDELFKQIRCIRCGPDGGWNQETHEEKHGS
ncbi:MAG: hypothetical protein H8E32_13260 [Nitrospinae bacterium]|nr:hypothetical protein [Nitrospinota bacterium]